MVGSSPLSRGIPIEANRSRYQDRIIPALAGNTLGERGQKPEKEDHPRSRGEYSSTASRSRMGGGSSPLSRGIRGVDADTAYQVRIIPALAGNTHVTREPSTHQQDHPRSRGEYAGGEVGEGLSPGSSPLSRGILLWAIGLPTISRIIPALAGNT